MQSGYATPTPQASQSMLRGSQALSVIERTDPAQSSNSIHSTLTYAGHCAVADGLESFDNQLAKLPLYSSDTRLLEFVDSATTLNSVALEGGEEERPSLSYPRNPLHQSDTRLLHASQIELKSTNYFTRPPLSCSSLEEEQESDYGDYMFSPASDYSNLQCSQSTITRSDVFNSNRSKSRRAQVHISGQSLRPSPDGSYFSIDSDDEDGDFDLYENVAALRLGSQLIPPPPSHESHEPRPLLYDPHVPSPHESMRTVSTHDRTPTNSNSNIASSGTLFSNHDQLFYQGPSTSSDTIASSINHRGSTGSSTYQRNSDVDSSTQSNSAINSVSQRNPTSSSAYQKSPTIYSTDQRSGDRSRNGTARYQQSKLVANGANNGSNVHHNSNGSSAYGSGSLAASHESDIDTYL